ncbi:uncharacterized protein LOC135400949 isoform X2 [Ornithodoros turicata]|uniref:uncharacterized protein LOC135400949 isoform X2 n=1 Tax=Ornithodoros turicata TaxID=34597 RepID=UPI0031392F4D
MRNKLRSFENFIRSTPRRPDVRQKVLSLLDDLWHHHVMFYGALDGLYGDDTDPLDIVSFMREILSYKHARFDSSVYVYAFAGITVLITVSNDPINMFVTYVRDLFSQALVDVLVYQTSYRPPIQCVANGPAPWSFQLGTHQSSIVGSAVVRSKINIPPGKVEMFTSSLCAIKTKFQIEATLSTELKMGRDTSCLASDMDSVTNYTCPNAPDASHVYRKSVHQIHEIYKWKEPATGGNSYYYILVYDTEETLAVKVCRATKDIGFKGGWVLRDLPCGFIQSCQHNSAHQGLLKRVILTKSYLHEGYFNDSCPTYGNMTGSSDEE